MNRAARLSQWAILGRKTAKHKEHEAFRVFSASMQVCRKNLNQALGFDLNQRKNIEVQSSKHASFWQEIFCNFLVSLPNKQIMQNHLLQ